MSFTLKFNVWNSYCSLAIGTFLNGFLLNLSRKEYSKELKDYRSVIIYFSLWNISTLFFHAMNLPLVIFSTNSFTYMFAQGIVASIPYIRIRTAIMTIYYLCLVQILVSLALQFFHRYLTICRSYKNKKVEFAFYSSCFAFFALSIICTELIATPSTDVQHDEIPEMRTIISVAEFNSIKITMKYDPSNPFLVLLISMIIIFLALCYFAIIFCFLRIRIFLKKNIMDNSHAKKRKTLNQISLNMILQAILPSYCLFLVIVAIFSILFGIFNSFLVELGMLIFPVINWLPILNPLVTILTISEYRKCFLKMIRLRKDEQSTVVVNLSIQPAKIFPRPSQN